MPYEEVNGTRLFFTVENGTAGDVLLVHGGGCDSHDWSWEIPRLAERGYRVIAVDLRGHGRSEVPAGGYTPREFADDLAILLRQLDAERVVVMGHSLGGAVVSALAVEHPDLVDGVVTVDPAYGADPELTEPMLARAAAMRTGDAHAGALDLIASTYTSATPAFLRTWHRRRLMGVPAHVLASVHESTWAVPEQFGFRPESEAFLAGRRCPVLSIWRRPVQAEWERSIVSDDRSVVLAWEGHGHWLHQERPDDFHATILDWMPTR